MTVKELKEKLNSTTRFDDNEVKIRVNTPGEYISPGGATVDVKSVFLCGIDWDRHNMLIIPSNRLDISNIDNWSKGKTDYDK